MNPKRERSFSGSSVLALYFTIFKDNSFKKSPLKIICLILTESRFSRYHSMLPEEGRLRYSLCTEWPTFCHWHYPEYYAESNVSLLFFPKRLRYSCQQKLRFSTALLRIEGHLFLYCLPIVWQRQHFAFVCDTRLCQCHSKAALGTVMRRIDDTWFNCLTACCLDCLFPIHIYLWIAFLQFMDMVEVFAAR